MQFYQMTMKVLRNLKPILQKNIQFFYDRKKKVNKILKQEVKPFKLGRMPALLIIDKKGIIKYAYYSDYMDDIPTIEEIFKILKEI